MVAHIHVLSIFAHIGALHVRALQVTEGGDYNVRVKLHKKRDKATLTQVVWNQTRLLFCKLKDLVIRIRGNVVDTNVRI